MRASCLAILAGLLLFGAAAEARAQACLQGDPANARLEERVNEQRADYERRRERGRHTEGGLEVLRLGPEVSTRRPQLGLSVLTGAHGPFWDAVGGLQLRLGAAMNRVLSVHYQLSFLAGPWYDGPSRLLHAHHAVFAFRLAGSFEVAGGLGLQLGRAPECPQGGGRCVTESVSGASVLARVGYGFRLPNRESRRRLRFPLALEAQHTATGAVRGTSLLVTFGVRID